jgi:SAM-dependent methyltransferase
MLTIEEQVASGKLVCPQTRSPLHFADGALVSACGKHSYRQQSGVPILLRDTAAAAQYVAAGPGHMTAEYARSPGAWRARLACLAEAVGDGRSPAAHDAFSAIFRDLPQDALCISVGGGPRRIHERLVNVNIGPFPNVDIVADAYGLPYANDVVDAVHCEAVLEHLEYPEAAVGEIARVLRPGRLAFAATPFLQAFHGYPDHYQNFTLSGHRRLFERCGLTIVAAGNCVGGAFALRDLSVNYIRNVIPGGQAGRFLAPILAWLTLPFLWIDRFGNGRPNASMVASTTYLLARKAP